MSMFKRDMAPFFTRMAVGVTMVLAATQIHAALIVWGGTAGNTNWGTAASWIGGVAPTSADDVKFYDSGNTATASNVDNIVDGTFAGSIGSIQFGNTNLFHTTYITNGMTLNITGANGFYVGTTNDNGNAQIVNATITGGGAVNISGTSTPIVVDQGRSANGNGTQRAILDMSGLYNFTANAYSISVGTTTFGGANNAQNATGTLKLGQTNVVTLGFIGTAITSSTVATPTNAIQIGSDNGNAGGVDFFFLGQSNMFFIDSIGVGCLKTTGTMLFNAGLNSPIAYFRGTGGVSSRIRFWSIGDMASSGSSSGSANGTNDFTGGSVDILVDTMSLGRDRQGGNTGAGTTRGTLTFGAGTIDVNTVYVGNQQFTASANSNPMSGVVNVNGPTALLRVNNNLYLGRTSINSTAAAATTGILNVTNGSVWANNIIVGTNSSLASTTDTINLFNASLIVSNSLATNATGLVTFNVSNSTIGLTLTANGSLKGLVQNLNTFAPTNYILLNPATTIFSSYPQQFPLIKYTVWNGSNTFGLTTVPGWAPGATLVSNSANKSLDILIPADPRPVITAQPTPYSGSPGDNVTSAFTVGIAATSVTPLGYQWYSVTNGVTNTLTDGSGLSGLSTLSGSAGANLQIMNAQTNDSGNYFCVITNTYGTNTSIQALLTISSGSVAPSISGPANVVATNGIATFIADTVSGSPVPTLQWQYNGTYLADGAGPSGSSTISGSGSATLTIVNPQYPGDQGTYTLIASNSAGLVTSNTFFTVLVPPVITTQPSPLVVTNTQSASFTAAATGVPSPWYIWKKNGSPISSAANNTATNATLVISSTSPSDTASYSCTITNLAGTTNTVSVALTVNSTMSVATLLPANGQTGVCYDTPLYITFSSAPSLANSGNIKIFNANNTSTPVDTINLANSAANGTQAHSTFPGDGQPFNYFPVVINGTTAAIYPHGGVMTSNQTYYVTIDDGAFLDANGAYFAGITASNVWRFSTKVGGPANTNNLIVAKDYSGDFATVQGAVDSVPLNNTTPTLINISNGIYFEIVDISSKNNLLLRGQNRNGTVVGYLNNAGIAPGGTTHARMAIKVNANDIAFDNLTLTNMTVQGGSQAEALMVESGAKRCIVNNSEIDSRQDTVLGNVNSSQAYFYKSTIKGNFDYIWGGANFLFNQCTMDTITGTGNANLTAARTDTSASTSTNFPWSNPGGTFSANGMSFIFSAFTADPGVGPVTLADGNGSAGNVVSWYDCTFATNYIAPSATLFSGNFDFWQDLNTTNGVSVTYANVVSISGTDPRLLAATNIPVWFYGWVPQLAPNILTNPVSQTGVPYGTNVTFGVTATGIPDPTYQWLYNSTPIPGANGATLVLPGVTPATNGSYSVAVTTTAGSVTSSPASLTVAPPSNTAPVFTGPIPGTNFTINVGTSLAVSCLATDADIPAQTLSYSLLVNPSGAAVDSSGNFTWRPTTAQGNTVNPVKVVVTDNGVPPLSATNNFTVTVNTLTAPAASAPAYAGGQFTASVTGQIGPDYALQVSTNLVSGSWKTVAVTNSPAAVPFTLTDTNAVQPMQFYRIVAGPPLP